MTVQRVGAARYRAAPYIEPSKEAGLSAPVVPQSLVVAALRRAFGFFSAVPVGAGGQPVYHTQGGIIMASSGSNRTRQ